MVGALDDTDASALLAAAMPGAIDERVRERILAEARGNPLALLQLRTGPTPAELAGGYGLAQSRPLARRIEGSFTVQLRELPRETRQLLLIADGPAERTALTRCDHVRHRGKTKNSRLRVYYFDSATWNC